MWQRITTQEDTGAALTGAMLVTLLMAAITAGFTALVITDSRVRYLDGTRTQSFYVAHAGLEKLTADLGDLFANNFAPTGAQINALMAGAPNLEAQWLQPDGTPGYTITFPANAQGNPISTVTTVSSGAFQGLVGLATPYTMTVTARLNDGSEASLTRTLQTVAIPIFQFGIFSENDLSFFAGPNFNSAAACTVKPMSTSPRAGQHADAGRPRHDSRRDRAHEPRERQFVGDAARRDGARDHGAERVPQPRDQRGEPRRHDRLRQNEPTWTNLSTGSYNHNIINGRTGAKPLVLPITSFGGQPIGLIHRPAVNEKSATRTCWPSASTTLASLRILLSDTQADITNLPGIVAATPPSPSAT